MSTPCGCAVNSHSLTTKALGHGTQVSVMSTSQSEGAGTWHTCEYVSPRSHMMLLRHGSCMSTHAYSARVRVLVCG